MDVQTNWSAGEISRAAAARFDQQFYTASAEKLLNLMVDVEGGVRKRGGLKFIAEVKTNADIQRLIPFKRANDDVDILEIGPVDGGGSYVRMYDAATGARHGTVELTAPWDEDELPLVYRWQSASVMFFTCKNGLHPPHILVRFTDENWTLSQYDIVLGPFQTKNFTDAFLLDPTGVTGTVTITATGGHAPFQIGHVGSRFRLFAPFGGVAHETWAPEKAVTLGDTVIYDGNVYECTVAGTTTRTPPIHLSGAVTDGGLVKWLYRHDLSGTVKITNWTSPFQVSATVEERLASDVGTSVWAESHFSNARGWPFVGANFQSRLYFAGSPSFPDTLWGSRIDGFGISSVDFKQSAGGGEVNDDHAVVRTLNDDEVNRIAWMVPGEQIVLGHAGGVVRVTGPSLNEPITPAGASAVRPERPPGSNFICNGIRASGTIVYATTSGLSVIALDPNNFSYRTISARAAHKAKAGIAELAYAKEPFARLFSRANDHELHPCTYDSEQDVVAWTSFEAGGAYQDGPPQILSHCVAPLADGRDVLWVIVRRTINGATRTFLERMAPDFDGDTDDLDQATFSDSHVAVDQWQRTAARFVVTGSTERDATVTVTATNHAFDSADIGKELRLRLYRHPSSDQPYKDDVRVLIATVNAGVATGTLLLDIDPARLGVSLDEWGYAVSSVTVAHLVGESVGLFLDGVDAGDMIVPGDGVVPLPSACMRACVGLRYQWSGRSVRLVTFGGRGAMMGTLNNVGCVWVSYQDAVTMEAKVRVLSDGVPQRAEEVVPPSSMTPAGRPPLLRRGEVLIPVGAQKAKAQQIEIYGNGLGPFRLLAVGVET